MSASFPQAVSESLAILKSIRSGFGVPPTASAASLERLRAMAAAPRRHPVPAPAADPDPPPASTAGDAADPLASLRAEALVCVKCPHLAASRTQVVFGVGNPRADLMFVGEAPGADEDVQGEPFVGRAGQLLTKIILAMGFTRDDVYIANVLKCRPDTPGKSFGNRKPRPEEMKTCLPWLEKQIALIKPKAMVALGATALEGLLGATGSVGSLRGKWLDFRGIPVMATYHPAYLLRNQSISEKRKVWEDMLKVLEKLNLPVSEKQRQFFTKSNG